MLSFVLPSLVAFHGGGVPHAPFVHGGGGVANAPFRFSYPHACAVARDFDALVAQSSAESIQQAMRLLSSTPSLQLSREQTAALLDAVCASSFEEASPAAEPNSAPVVDRQREQQAKLTAVYDALSRRSELRGYGSVSAMALLPLGVARKELSTEDQLVLTGLPTTAFAPPAGGSGTDRLIGAGGALALVLISSQLGLDLRIVLGAVGAALLADSVLVGGAISESLTRAVKPGYATTVREHEAGHFLAAYLLGMPIEACLLDPWKVHALACACACACILMEGAE